MEFCVGFDFGDYLFWCVCFSDLIDRLRRREKRGLLSSRKCRSRGNFNSWPILRITFLFVGSMWFLLIVIVNLLRLYFGFEGFFSFIVVCFLFSSRSLINRLFNRQIDNFRFFLRLCKSLLILLSQDKSIAPR